jgi:hypothetical protein
MSAFQIDRDESIRYKAALDAPHAAVKLLERTITLAFRLPATGKAHKMRINRSQGEP